MEQDEGQAADEGRSSARSSKSGEDDEPSALSADSEAVAAAASLRKKEDAKAAAGDVVDAIVGDDGLLKELAEALALLGVFPTVEELDDKMEDLGKAREGEAKDLQDEAPKRKEQAEQPSQQEGQLVAEARQPELSLTVPGREPPTKESAKE